MDEQTRTSRRTRRRYEALTERLDREVDEVSPGVFAVPSRSDPNDFHLVVLRDGEMVCDCPANVHGQPCRHAEAVLIFRGNTIYSHRLARPESESWYSAPRPLRKVPLL